MNEQVKRIEVGASADGALCIVNFLLNSAYYGPTEPRIAAAAAAVANR